MRHRPASWWLPWRRRLCVCGLDWPCVDRWAYVDRNQNVRARGPFWRAR